MSWPLTWQDHHDKIQPGDVFVKRWGKRNLVHVMIPWMPRSNKQPYMILDSGNTEATWNKRRSTYGNTTTDRRWRFVGTIPEHYLNELLKRGTLR